MIKALAFASLALNAALGDLHEEAHANWQQCKDAWLQSTREKALHELRVIDMTVRYAVEESPEGQYQEFILRSVRRMLTDCEDRTSR